MVIIFKMQNITLLKDWCGLLAASDDPCSVLLPLLIMIITMLIISEYMGVSNCPPNGLVHGLLYLIKEYNKV